MSPIHKLIIIGSGPAGYAAGVYAARALLEPLLLAGNRSGGQLMFTTQVENYVGFEQGILGPDLMMSMRAQAQKFGTTIVDRRVTKVDTSQRPFTVEAGEEQYRAQAIILATGASSKMLSIPGEEYYLGRGVATCAVCDAAFYRDKVTAVVGGGDAAMEDAIALTKYADRVLLLVRGQELRASKIMQQRVLEHPKIEVKWQTQALEVLGNKTKVTGVRLLNLATKQEQTIPIDGFFLAIGHEPATTFLQGSGVELDAKGYVVTRLGLEQASLALAQKHLDAQGQLPFPTMTSVEGIFAAGDNVDFRYRQAITAAGYGTMAALDAQWWLERQAT